MFATGGGGRMGRELLPRLERRGWSVARPSSRQLDITDERAVAAALRGARPDVVLHLAAYTDVAGAERDRDRCWAVNVTGARNVAAHAGCRLVHLSTDYAFDGERGGYAEGETPSPANYYSLTKVVGEEAARRSPDALIVRSSFKESRWPYPVAFDDQFTSADYVDVIGDELEVLLVHLDAVRPPDGVLHVATERKSVFELARRRNPEVRPGSRAAAGVRIPPDVSLDTSRWAKIKLSLAPGA